jgi:GNS1/SUR4 family
MLRDRQHLFCFAGAVTTAALTCSDAQAPRALFGGYWLPSTLAVAYACLLYHWSRQMRAKRAAGGDPFKGTALWPAIAGTLFYLAALFVGKRVMAARPPFDCKKHMLVYNAYQVALNVWCVAEFAREISGYGEGRNMRFWGNRYDPSMAGFRLGFVVWVHYNNKYVELLDTLWMLLRKKDQQVRPSLAAAAGCEPTHSVGAHAYSDSLQARKAISVAQLAGWLRSLDFRACTRAHSCLGCEHDYSCACLPCLCSLRPCKRCRAQCNAPNFKQRIAEVAHHLNATATDNLSLLAQISFLHVYHHGLMIWAWLYVCKLECGGDAWFGAAVNSAVHVVMYSYYLLSGLGYSCPWKRYLTRAQMAQFCVCMVHAAYVLVVGNAPVGLAVAQAFVMLNMFVLFSQFYCKRYSKAGAEREVRKQA